MPTEMPTIMPSEGEGSQGSDRGSDDEAAATGEACDAARYDILRDNHCVESATNCKSGVMDSPAGDERMSTLCTSSACIEHLDCLKEALSLSGCLADGRARNFNSISDLCGGRIPDTCLASAVMMAMEAPCDGGSHHE
jgi:hypothetical protein